MRLAFLLAVFVVSGCAPLARELVADSPGGLLFQGYTKADVDCYRCHSGKATGSWRGPSLKTPTVEFSQEQLHGTIKDGDGGMPAFKDRLTDEEIDQIIAWLKTQFPAPAPAEKPADKPAAEAEKKT
jgi:mono/diheme cytochrome c family protein